MKLIIGNKNYSSWSLRSWLLLREAGIPFEEELISFNAQDFDARVGKYSPTGRVPVLVDGNTVVWDSMAIAEYLAERFPDKRLWPEGREQRARARSVCAEMHAGFVALRQAMPMNCRARFSGGLWTSSVRNDIGRVVELWADCRKRARADGSFLFGAFGIADAFFAPVASRFVTYGITLPAVAQQVVDSIESLSGMREWNAAAQTEKDTVEDGEPYGNSPSM